MGYPYQITVSHPELGKVRILTGSDTYILESRARELKQRWNEQYEKKLDVERRAEERHQRSQHLQESQEEARERTDSALSERQSLEALLATAVASGFAFSWETLKDQTAYPTPLPLPPVYKLHPFEPSGEGATKGILVTTADYGPDAYQFAANKPLSLLNGANLLHLLEKHGHTVRINLRQARQAAADQKRSAERSDG